MPIASQHRQMPLIFAKPRSALVILKAMCPPERKMAFRSISG